MASCSSCGQWIPDNQGSSSCSMCYGDIDHGKDGYYRRYMEEMQEAEEAAQQQIDDRQLPDDGGA